MIQLNFRKLEEKQGGQSLIIMHGLFGMLDNWLTLAKRYASMGFVVYLIDLRNHGKSPHQPNHDYYLMADDLYDFMNDNDIESAIIMGHSMGGKVAMQFACTYPEKVFKLAVVDIAPKDYGGGHEMIFEAILAIDLKTIKSRSEVKKLLLPTIRELGVVQFLMKNLKRNKSTNGFEWKANFIDLQHNYQTILSNSLSPYDEFDGATLFINGGKSDKYISKNDTELITKYFPQAKITEIKEAGHWVHAEKPDELFDLTLTFFES